MTNSGDNVDTDAIDTEDTSPSVSNTRNCKPIVTQWGTFEEHNVDPDLIITVDSPGFTFRVLKKLKSINPKLQNLHIVAPTVWAWKPDRAKKISYYIDNLFVLYPFEKKYFTPHGIKTYFIGHPLVETINKSNSTFNKRKRKYIS